MKYNFDIPDSDISVANSPELGGESRVKLSFEDIFVLGQVAQPAPNSGILTDCVPAFAFNNVNGNDLALVPKTAIISAVDVVVQFNVRFQDNTTGTASATFLIPDFAQNQSANLPIGLAVDVNGDNANVGKKIVQVFGVASVTGGQANNVFNLVCLPSTWYMLGCAKNKKEELNIPQGKPIACGLNGSAFTKFGLSKPGKLDLEALHFTYGDGLGRLNGHSGSVLVEVYKEGRVLSERCVYGGFKAAVDTQRADGDDETKDMATGYFESFAKFV